MTTIELLLGTALVVLVAATAGRTLSSDPKWGLPRADQTGPELVGAGEPIAGAASRA